MIVNGKIYKKGKIIFFEEFKENLDARGYSLEDLIGLASGRMQPFHNGHEWRLKEIMKGYKWTHVGIALPYPKDTRLKGERYTIEENFLNYIERYEIIYAAVEEISKQLKRENHKIPKITIGPHFPLPDYPKDVFWNYVPGNDDITIHHNTLKTDFDIKKLEMKKNLERTVILMPVYGSYAASTIRSLMLKKNSDWRKLVPSYTVDVIERNKCIDKLFSMVNSRKHCA